MTERLASVRPVLVRTALLVLAAAAVIFCVIQLVASWSTLTEHLSRSNVPLALASLALSALSMWCFALLWQHALRMLKERRSLRDVSSWFFVGELGKYVPGGIWGVTGRSEIAHLAGVSRTVAYSASVLSVGLMAAGGAITCALALPWTLPVGSLGLRVGLLVAALLLVLAATHPAVTRRILGIARRLSNGNVDLMAPRWAAAVRATAIAIAPWVLAAASTVLLKNALGFAGSDLVVANAAVAAWVIGLLAVPVPAGAGIREAAFVVISGMEPGEAAALAVLARALLIVVDASAALIALPLVRKSIRLTRGEQHA